MIVNQTDSGLILSRYDADHKLIELDFGECGKRMLYMRPYQAEKLIDTLQRLVHEASATRYVQSDNRHHPKGE